MGFGQYGNTTYGNTLAKGSPRERQRKFVFGSHANTCHVWAQQNDATLDGRSGDGRIKFEGATIYSYGQHFPMAHFTDKKYDGQRIVLVTTQRYSVSTGKHQSHVWGALHGLDVAIVHVADLKSWLDPSLKWTKGARQKLRRKLHDDALERLAEGGRDARAEYEAARIALGITAQEPKDVGAWLVERKAKAARAMAAERVRWAMGLVKSIKPEIFSANWKPAPDATGLNAWSCQDKLNQLKYKVRDLYRARNALAKTKRYPRLMQRASAGIKAGKALSAAWEALRLAAVDREYREADLAKLAELRAWLAAPTGKEPSAFWNFEGAARLAGVAYREGQPDLGDALRDHVNLKRWRLEVPATYKPAYEREDITPEQWQAGKGSAYFSASLHPTLLRKVGDRLQTSRGAECPWSHAVFAFKVAQNCRAHGVEWQSNGHTLRVGHYQVDKITPEGELVAGCHRLQWPEMERLALKEVPEVLKPRFPLPVPLTLPTSNWLIDFDPAQGRYVA